MEHVQSATDPLDLPTAPGDNQVNAQLYHVLAVLVKDGAMKKARNAPVGDGSESWRLLCEDYEPRQKQRCQAMLSAILRVQLREPLGESLDNFEKQVHAYEDQSGKPIPDELLAATVVAGSDNATEAQHLALKDDTLDTYPKIVAAVRSFVRASRGWNRECSNCGTKGHIARHCKNRINDEKAKAGQHRDKSKGNRTSVTQRVEALETSTSKGQVENASSVPVSSLLFTLQQRTHRWQDKLQEHHHLQRCSAKPDCKTSGQIPTVICECA